MKFKVMLIEAAEIREIQTMGYIPQPSAVIEYEGRRLVPIGSEMKGSGGWIYVIDEQNRPKS